MAEYVSLVSIQGRVEQSFKQAVKSTRTSLSTIQSPLNALSSFAIRDVESAVTDLGQKGKQTAENLGDMVPKFKTVGIAGGALIGILAAGTAALAKFGGEAHSLNDIATASNITTRGFQQMDFALQGFGTNSEAVARNIVQNSTRISDAYADVTKRAALLQDFSRPGGLGSLGFDLDVFIGNDPAAIIAESRRLIEQEGATLEDIRIGLGRAGFGEEAVQEIQQVVATAESWEKYRQRLASAPIISQGQIDGLASFRTLLEDTKDRVMVGMRDEFYQLSSAGSGFTDSNREVLDGLELIGRFSLTSLIAGFKFLITVVDATVTSISMFVDAGKIGLNELGKAWNDSRIGVLKLQKTWYATQDAILGGIDKVLGAASYLPSWLGGNQAQAAQDNIANIRSGTQDRLAEIDRAREAIEKESEALDDRTNRVRGDIQNRGEAFQSRFQNDADEVTTRFNRDIARVYGTPEENQRYDEAIQSFESGGSRDIAQNPNYGREPATFNMPQQPAKVEQHNTYHITANDDLASVMREIEASQLRQVQELVG